MEHVHRGRCDNERKHRNLCSVTESVYYVNRLIRRELGVKYRVERLETASADSPETVEELFTTFPLILLLALRRTTAGTTIEQGTSQLPGKASASFFNASGREVGPNDPAR